MDIDMNRESIFPISPNFLFPAHHKLFSAWNSVFPFRWWWITLSGCFPQVLGKPRTQPEHKYCCCVCLCVASLDNSWFLIKFPFSSSAKLFCWQSRETLRGCHCRGSCLSCGLFWMTLSTFSTVGESLGSVLGSEEINLGESHSLGEG